VEDRISELEDKMKIKGKTEELLVKQLKTCNRNMQELTNSIKRPNLSTENGNWNIDTNCMSSVNQGP
jgi:hypothetical protein